MTVSLSRMATAVPVGAAPSYRDVLSRLVAGSLDGTSGSSLGSSVSSAQPGFFGPTARPLFGCWHPPAEGVCPRDVAVVLCSPHGPEEAAAHHVLRQVAEALAADGTPVLRFDLDGCGDSAGDDLDPGRVQAWLSSIEAALAAAREASGCHRFALVGFQLGALLSAQLLRRHPEVVAWVGVAPPASGRQFLRERLAMGSMQPQPNTAADDTLLETAGTAYTRATREALATVALEALDSAPGRTRLVLLQRQDLPLPAKARAELPERVDLRSFEGYAEMVCEPHFSRVPPALMAALRECIGGLSAGEADAPAARDIAAPVSLGSTGSAASVFGRGVAQWDGLVEAPVTIGPHGLQGVLTLPARQPVRRTLLLLNAGAVRRVGPSRLYTQLARRWAGRGVAVLRVDVGGLGESPSRPGVDRQVVYGLHAVDDAVQAARWLAAVTGVPQAQVLGLCSGAVHALQATQAGAPVAQVVAINPLVFHHAPGAPLPSGLSTHAAAAIGQAVQRGWRNAALWRRLLTGQLPMRAVAQRLGAWATARLGQSLRSVGRAVSRVSGHVRPDDLPQALRRAALRDVRQHFIFSAGEPGEALLMQEAGRCVRGLEALDLLSRQSIGDADHTFTTTASRLRLAECLDALVPPPAEVGLPVPALPARQVAPMPVPVEA